MSSKTFLERYQAGEHVAVWDELMALGKGVRHELYLEDATAVAAETMRRVRHNVEVLIPRLAEQGYRFVAPQDDQQPDLDESLGRMAQNPPLENRAVFDRPDHQTAAGLRQLEKAAGGPLPLSLRAYYEQVGGVCLMGSHPLLNPIEEGPGDPLVVASIGEMLGMIEALGMEGDDEIGLWIAPDDFHKANISGGEPYTIKIPDANADAPFLYECHKTTFVNYLRIAFQWGGLPGWDQPRRKAPREALAELSEGLMTF